MQNINEPIKKAFPKTRKILVDEINESRIKKFKSKYLSAKGKKEYKGHHLLNALEIFAAVKLRSGLNSVWFKKILKSAIDFRYPDMDNLPTDEYTAAYVFVTGDLPNNPKQSYSLLQLVFSEKEYTSGWHDAEIGQAKSHIKKYSNENDFRDNQKLNSYIQGYADKTFFDFVKKYRESATPSRSISRNSKPEYERREKAFFKIYPKPTKIQQAAFLEDVYNRLLLGSKKMIAGKPAIDIAGLKSFWFDRHKTDLGASLGRGKKQLQRKKIIAALRKT